MATQTLETLKQNLNFRISRIDKEESLRKIAKAIDIVEHIPTKKQSEMLKELSTSIGEKTDIDEIIREQNWKPASRDEIDEILKDFDWQISDEDFIELLKNI